MEKRLGKGLEALISEDVSKSKEKVENIQLIDIVPNTFQPRKRFSNQKMQDLVSSIREKGIIQPILVRPSDNGYELIAGERRWRAAKELGLEEIPALIRREINDVSSLEISIIENIQREELNPIEEANGYRELIEKFEYTLDRVGQMVGKNKTTISNALRILGLSIKIQTYIEDGSLSTGHAKVLLSVTSENKRDKISATIIKNGLSVRDTEHLVKRIANPMIRVKKQKDPEIALIEEELQHKLGTKVTVRQGKKRGRIEIQYFSNKDLQRLLQVILKDS